MTTQRVAAADVIGIFPAGAAMVLQPYIETATLIVSERLVGQYTEARLYEIEKWLSAHLAYLGSTSGGSSSPGGQVSSVKADEISITYNVAKLGEGMAASPFGQWLSMLDYKGILANDLRAIPTSFTVF